MSNGNFKVLKLKLIKPVNMTWPELRRCLRDARYRVFRLANLAVSEAYRQFHLWRTDQAAAIPEAKASHLNKRLREMLIEEAARKTASPPNAEAAESRPRDGANPEAEMDRFSKTGALPDTVTGALFRYKVRGLTSKQKWRQVVRGQSALPTFRNNMAIPIRCDKPGHKRLEKRANGHVVLDLMVTRKPYPRVLLGTRGIGEGAEAVVAGLLSNAAQAPDGYRQRYFEVKEDETHTWWVYVCYSLPPPQPAQVDAARIVGVDVGFSCPLYAAIGYGHARLGYRAFAALAARVQALKRRTMKRRREIQRGGRTDVSAPSARSGHGRKRKLLPTEKLQGRINRAYTTLNHQMSAAVVKFALDNGAGTIQMEDLGGLDERLSGTFLGQMWRYHQLQAFIAYKAKEKGITVRKVNPQFTSHRCSQCGYINAGFTRAARDRQAEGGYPARFRCARPECGFVADPDYNAARNLAIDGIAGMIEKQCREQGIPVPKRDEAGATQG